MRLLALALALLLAPLAFAAPSLAPAPEACAAEVRPTALAGPLPDNVTGSCPGIRPGAAISGCTMAWILRSGDTYYGTTAGHCANVGARVRISNPNTQVGTIVYSVDQPIGEDFAVFRIDPEDVHLIDPALCAFGAPSGVWDGEGGDDIVQHFGFGIGTGTLPTTRARVGALTYVSDTTFTFAGAAAPGDSGSPARLASGEALGVITDLIAVRSPGTGPLLPADPLVLSGAVIGTRLDHGIARAEAALGIDLELVTSV